jgi:hypothetical protein
MTTRYPKVCIAVPLHNEEAVIPELVRRIRATLDALPGTGHSVLFVDDGSTDRTVEHLGRPPGQTGVYEFSCCPAISAIRLH